MNLSGKHIKKDLFFINIMCCVKNEIKEYG